MRQPQPSPDDVRLLDPEGRFRARLRADRAALARLAAADPAGNERLRSLVHRLAGAAGTFGFGALGEVAIGLDDRMVERLPISAADLKRLRDALDSALRRPKKSA